MFVVCGKGTGSQNILDVSQCSWSVGTGSQNILDVSQCSWSVGKALDHRTYWMLVSVRGLWALDHRTYWMLVTIHHFGPAELLAQFLSFLFSSVLGRWHSLILAIALEKEKYFIHPRTDKGGTFVDSVCTRF